jgi:hypothetical protein
MKKLNTKGPGLCIGIPTLGRPVSLDWALAFKSLHPPINFNVNFAIIRNQFVAEARNAVAEYALKNECKYLFFLGDDVIVPAHTLRTLIYRLENQLDAGVVGGVYCSKCDPPAPLVFRGNGIGSYWDWKIGEFFECTGLGMDCTIIRTDIFNTLTKPWFKTVDTDQYLDGEHKAESWTEDLFFLKKVLDETEYKIYCDASVICEHQDIYGNRIYRLPKDSLPMRQLGTSKDKRCLVLGPAIALTDEITQTHDIVRGSNDDMADYRISLDSLPFEKEQFDWVLVTEPQSMLNGSLSEWQRVCRGKLSINFTNFVNREFIAKFLGGTVDGSFVNVEKVVATSV